MDHEKCFVLDEPNARPSKKRKLGGDNLQASLEQRKKLYKTLWTRQEKRINDVLQRVNQETLDNVLEFIDSTDARSQTGHLPAGIILGGPDLSFQTSLLKQLDEEIQQTRDSVSFVSLSSRDAGALKTLVRGLIQKATRRTDGIEDHDEPMLRRKGSKLLNYDLDILQDWSAEHHVSKFIVAFEDSEAFDTALLAETIDLLSSSSLPFALLFCVATSVENFQDRLPRAAIRRLKGPKFDAVQARDVFEQIFEATISGDDQQLWLGPNLCRMLVDRQNDHYPSVHAFTDALKYGYMCHFYANPLSLFINASCTVKTVPKDHFQAARNLHSFRRHVEQMLGEGKIDLARLVLDSDRELLEYIRNHLSSSAGILKRIAHVLKQIRKLRVRLQQSSDTPLSSLYMKAMSGDLNQSPLIRELLLSLKKAPSDILVEILEDLKSFDKPEVTEAAKRMARKLHALIATNGQAVEPLRSEYDIRQETLRTTVVAQKVELSKKKSEITSADSEYSKIVQDLHQTLEQHLKTTLIDAKTLFLHELFLYDIKSPHKDSFIPRPRFIIERALSAPYDYLNCTCCRPAKDFRDEPTMLPSNPPTSILYQLYLESGALINASDLQSAFDAMCAKEIDNEQRTRAIFQRALAELKYMGFIKPSRKKIDHVAKLSWKGL